MSATQFNFTTELSIARIAAIRKALMKRPMTAAELQPILLMGNQGICAFLRNLKDHHAHIVEWRQGESSLAPVWAWGAGESAPRPKWERPPPEAWKPPKHRGPVACRYKAPPARRDRTVEMLFGPALDLDGELRRMTA